MRLCSIFPEDLPEFIPSCRERPVILPPEAGTFFHEQVACKESRVIEASSDER